MIHVKRKLLFTNQVRFSINVEVLSDTKTLTVDDYIIQWLDPDGTSRNVDLPAEESSTNLMLMILNTGTTAEKTLIIRNDASSTIATLLPGMTGVFSCDGTDWKQENNNGVIYDKTEGKFFLGAVSGGGVPLYTISGGATDRAYFQNGDVIIERDDEISPQLKFKCNTDDQNGLIAFKDLGDNNQWTIAARSSDHATEPKEFHISQQYDGGDWYDPFTIKSQTPNDAFVLDDTGAQMFSENIYGCTLELKANTVNNSGTLKFVDSGDNQKWFFSARSSDHATEARQFKITEHHQGSSWYDPLTIKPQTPNNTLVLEPTKVNVGLPLVRSQTPQTLTGAGAVDIISSITHIVTTAANDLTLIDGSEGQEKFIVMKTDEGTGTLTPTNLGNGSTITFDDVGDSAHLLFTNGFWYFVGGTATLGA